MHFRAYCVGLLGVTSYVSAGPTRRRAAPTYKAYPERAQAVKEAFQFSWDGYYSHALGHDSYKPISNGYEDDR